MRAGQLYIKEYMSNTFKLACFDMDGTIIRNTNSVRYLCIINGMEEQVMRIEHMEDAGQVSWIEADHMKAQLMKGLCIEEVKHQFDKNIHLISGIDFVIDYLMQQGTRSILITSGPIQVARIIGERFSFKTVYGSDYQVINGCFTGKITSHLGEDGKLDCLRSYCQNNDISLNDCIAIGDSSSDIDIFRAVRKSIAINYSDALKGRASEYINTENLKDIVNFFVRDGDFKQ